MLLKNLRNKLLISLLVLISSVFADTFMYVTSYYEKRIYSYKILSNGELEDLHQAYRLNGTPEDMGTYNSPSNPNKFIYIAYSDSNRLAVWRVNRDGTLSYSAEYPTSAFPDPSSSVLFDKYLYVNSAKEGNATGFYFDPSTGKLSPMPSKLNTNGIAYGYMFSPSGKCIYEQYILENMISTIYVESASGKFISSTPKFAVGASPMHYASFNGYFYVLSRNAKGISKYKFTDKDECNFIPANKYESLSLDYKFDFIPLRMMHFDKFLFVTDMSNNINVFLIEPDSNLKALQVINENGLTGRSLVFNYPGYAYQPVFKSNKINRYKFDSTTGKLTLLNSYPTGIYPFHIAIFNTDD